MGIQLASQIVLSETDAEWTLLGSLFDALDRFGEMSVDVNPAWFSDQLARYMFDECKKLIDEGHTLSTPVVISLLPEDCAGIPRSRFYANARLSAVPADQLGGLIATLKDRWARRELMAAADAMKASAPLFGQDPYAIASDTVLALDTINAARAEKRTGTLATATEALFEQLRQPEGQKGAPTGLKELDRRLNGYVRGQLYVIVRGQFLAGQPHRFALPDRSITPCPYTTKTVGESCGWSFRGLTATSTPILEFTGRRGQRPRRPLGTTPAGHCAARSATSQHGTALAFR